jgi:hypothetical protein
MHVGSAGLLPTRFLQRWWAASSCGIDLVEMLEAGHVVRHEIAAGCCFLAIQVSGRIWHFQSHKKSVASSSCTWCCSGFTNSAETVVTLEKQIDVKSGRVFATVVGDTMAAVCRHQLISGLGPCRCSFYR